MYVLGVGLANPGNLGYSFGFMLLVENIGTGIFNRVGATFMDTCLKENNDEPTDVRAM